ncbi:seryl-tRNA synthetase, partial [Candidatus Sulcia muelleri str. Hc (Homalodisca coagulata)]
MLKVSFIEKNKKIIIIGLIKRNFYKLYLINYILFLYKKKKKIKSKLDNLIYYIKFFSKKIKNNEELIRNYSSFLKEKLKINIFFIKKIKNKIFEIIIKIPNLPFEEVQKEKNFFYKEILYKREIINNYKKKIYHWELGEKFKLFSTKKGAIISGNGFNVFFNKGALLQRSLIQFFLEKNISSGYIEYVLPYIVNINSVYGTGQIPDKKYQMYNINYDNLYLIPTGEVPLINIFKKTIFKESELPVKATTYTSCFRRESGSYGSKVRGL